MFASLSVTLHVSWMMRQIARPFDAANQIGNSFKARSFGSVSIRIEKGPQRFSNDGRSRFTPSPGHGGKLNI
jgi:hypothetical protein